MLFFGALFLGVPPLAQDALSCKNLLNEKHKIYTQASQEVLVKLTGHERLVYQSYIRTRPTITEGLPS